MRELGYKANPWAQKMQNTQTKMIALIAPYENNFYAESIIRFLTKQFKNIGYVCMIQHLDEKDELNPNLYPVDGFILLFKSYETFQKALIKQKTPFVIFDDQQAKGLNIQMDRYTGSILVADYFLKHKHQNFAFLGQSQNDKKFKGFNDRLKENKKQSLFFNNIDNLAGWTKEMEGQRIAIYCIGHLMSYQFILSLNNQIWQLGGNLSYIYWGIANTEFHKISKLSTIGQPPENLCQILLDHLSTDRKRSETKLILPELEDLGSL